MIDEAILKTLCYRDIFDYPLTEEEIAQFLIDQRASPEEIKRALAQLIAEGILGERNGFYFLRERESIVKTRLRREMISEEKFSNALKFAKMLRPIPWVKAVFLTGALAAGNAKEEDDLDLLVITSRNRVWLSRFLAAILFKLLGVKRSPGIEKSPNAICLNMFLAEDSLDLPDNEQSLYSAHEIALAKPLWAREGLHQRFLGENLWVRKYLPNLEIIRNKQYAISNKQNKPQIFSLLAYHFSLAMTLLDRLLQVLQLFYMRDRRTREIVERNRILFHPVDLAQKILPAFKVRVYRILHSQTKTARLSNQSDRV